MFAKLRKRGDFLSCSVRDTPQKAVLIQFITVWRVGVEVALATDGNGADAPARNFALVD